MNCRAFLSSCVRAANTPGGAGRESADCSTVVAAGWNAEHPLRNIRLRLAPALYRVSMFFFTPRVAIGHGGGEAWGPLEVTAF